MCLNIDQAVRIADLAFSPFGSLWSMHSKYYLLLAIQKTVSLYSVYKKMLKTVP